MMNFDDLQALKQQLIAHEGLRLRPYTDQKGKITIGVGRNLTDVGIFEEEAYAMLEHDISFTVNGILAAIPWADALNSTRFRVLVDVGFNVGLDGLLRFHKMLAAAQRGDYEQAALEIEHSQLAPHRASRLAMLMRSISKDLR